MTRDDIIRMAREANILEPVDLLESNQWRQDTIRELERFAALVAAAKEQEMLERIRHIIVQAEERGAAAEQSKCKGFASMLAQATVLAEREKCAQLVETYELASTKMGAPEFVMVFKDCAASIRARGQA